MSVAAFALVYLFIGTLFTWAVLTFGTDAGMGDFADIQSFDDFALFIATFIFGIASWPIGALVLAMYGIYRLIYKR